MAVPQLLALANVPLQQDVLQPGTKKISAEYLRWLNDVKALVQNAVQSGGGGGTIDASQIVSGIIDLARIAGLTNNQIATGANIAWDKINKVGSSLADLDVRSASDLSSGTLPDGRFPAVLPAVSGALLTNLPSTGGTWSVLCNGNADNPEVVFDAFGDAIMVHIP